MLGNNPLAFLESGIPGNWNAWILNTGCPLAQAGNHGYAYACPQHRGCEE
jgi:hypothetical protein